MLRLRLIRIKPSQWLWRRSKRVRSLAFLSILQEGIPVVPDGGPTKFSHAKIVLRSLLEEAGNSRRNFFLNDRRGFGNI